MTYKCTACNETKTEVIEKLEHVTKSVTVDATCTTAGYTEVRCTLCDKLLSHEDTEALGHTWDEGTATTEATCDSEGTMTYKCTACNETKTEVIPMLDHIYNEGVVTKESTCSEHGTRLFTCTVCGHEETKEEPLADHSLVYTSVKTAATCTATGEDIYTCSVCGETVIKETPVDLENHNFIWNITEESGIFIPGVEEKCCADCGYKTGETKAVQPLGAGGWWESDVVLDTLGGDSVECRYYLNIDEETNVISVERLLHSDSSFISSMCIEGTDTVSMAGFDHEDFIILTGEDNPEKENWLGAIAGAYYLEKESWCYGVIFDDGETFKLEMSNIIETGTLIFTFTRKSNETHEHTLTAPNSYDEYTHIGITSCEEHDNITAMEYHKWVDGICSICGREQ